MATFVHNLWESIFTPGPTPTLLVATNATFAALQLVLGALLFTTWSIHFVVLSILSAGLWWSINWFAGELKAHQLQEEEKAGRAREAPAISTAAVTGSESETEVETAAGPDTPMKKSKPRAARTEPSIEVRERTGDLKNRVAGRAGDPVPASPQGLRSGVSTEDEWEKISENEKDR